MGVQVVSKEELQSKLGSPSVLVFDVLPRSSYATMHIAGTESLPLDEIQAGAWEKLDESKEIIVYCADLACQTSKRAAEFLRGKGFNVKAYEGGIKEWSKSGLPVEGTALKFFKIKPKQ